MEQLLTALLEALWFFAPALIANQCPGFARLFNFPLSRKPIWTRGLGKNKTVGAYYAGIVGAVGTIYLQRLFDDTNAAIELINYGRNDLWLVGSCFGFGAVAGDHAKSFVKRRLGRLPGSRWWPFDQTDFILGATFATAPFAWIGWGKLLLLLTFVACIYHPLGNWAAYKLRLRSTPW